MHIGQLYLPLSCVPDMSHHVDGLNRKRRYERSYRRGGRPFCVVKLSNSLAVIEGQAPTMIVNVGGATPFAEALKGKGKIRRFGAIHA